MRFLFIHFHKRLVVKMGNYTISRPTREVFFWEEYLSLTVFGNFGWVLLSF